MAGEKERGCPVCQGGAPTPHVPVQGRLYLRCGDCGLVYVETIAPPDRLQRSYTGGFWKSLRRRLFGPFRKLTGVKNYRTSLGRARTILDFGTSRSFPVPGRQPRYLDIGCNKGFNLVAAMERGWDPYGIETVTELILPFRNQYPSHAGKVHTGGFPADASKFPGGSFDLITAIDVIEHFTDPREALRTAFDLLGPDGVLILQTPDTDDPEASRSGGAWGALKPMEHLHLFNRRNLDRLAREVGFPVRSYHEPFERADGNFTAVLGKREAKG